jgi:hypothetical protein
MHHGQPHALFSRQVGEIIFYETHISITLHITNYRTFHDLLVNQKGHQL